MRDDADTALEGLRDRLIDRALKAGDNAAELAVIGASARALCDRFPIYR
jgi:hypothetical protein